MLQGLDLKLLALVNYHIQVKYSAQPAIALLHLPRKFFAHPATP
jgi:hypothetical protein